MMKILISCQKLDILKLHFFVSLPFKKYTSNKLFFLKKKYGRDPWDKIMLDVDGKP